LQQFTAFHKAAFEFVPGINVFVGANGAGKTHLLKILYSLLFCNQDKKNLPTTSQKLVRTFRPDEGRLGRLVRRQQGRNKCQIVCERDREKLAISFDTASERAPTKGRWHEVNTPVYIPVKEMLSMAPGFRSIYSKYDTQFEEIYSDIIDLAYLPPLKGDPDQERKDLMQLIHDLVDGQIISEGETFFIKNGQDKLEITLVAEGMRKLALLALLIQNGSLQKGTTLFWDEPEANLNPTMMQHVARILLKLASLEVQVFIATHSYSFLKELELQREDDESLRYFSLYATKEGVQVELADNYLNIEPNLIADEYTRIYELELDRSLGGVK
jgi:predicted ATP-binding protein involved in virulence